MKYFRMLMMTILLHATKKYCKAFHLIPKFQRNLNFRLLKYNWFITDHSLFKQRILQHGSPLVDMMGDMVSTRMTVNDADTSNQASSGVDPAVGSLMAGWPVKVMIFVDGTWLYYSIYGRGDRSDIRRKYGQGWEYRHQVEWRRLPILIARALQEQLRQQQGIERFVEVTRTVVFSSMRADTGEDTFRQRMFKKMQQSNFEVHLMTTSGLQEKCVDIACAVEMLHYATVPGAYDLAVMVTGDKDFAPALSRTRQKGKQVAIASMRNGCNQFLMDPSSHVRDFNIIWLDDVLHHLISKVHVPPGLTSTLSSNLPSKLYLEQISELIEDKGGSVSSRDLGRHLQHVTLDGVDALTRLKQVFGSLRNFLAVHPDIFILNSDLPGLDAKEFMIEFKDPESALAEKFLEDEEDEQEIDTEASEILDTPDFLEERLTGFKVSELKDMLKSRALPISGKKIDLVMRLIPVLLQEQETKSLMSNKMEEMSRRRDAVVTSQVSNGPNPAAPTSHTGTQTHNSVEPMVQQFLTDATRNHLVKKVKGFLHEQAGNRVSSREIGRFLSSEAAVDSFSHGSALAELKHEYKSLRAFLVNHPEHFSITFDNPDAEWEFSVTIVPQPQTSSSRLNQ